VSGETVNLLFDGNDAETAIILAHGAGVGMESPFMEFFAGALSHAGFCVARFEFPYMARRRETGRKSAPDAPRILRQTWLDAIERVPGKHLVIGGKSMGGRIASLIADEVSAHALICLGYPFHPPGKPDVLRTEHLQAISTPTLILQGERDPFGKQPEVEQYELSKAIKLHWVADGDHSFKPRKSSATTQLANFEAAAAAIVDFLGAL
jgi:predicted alpha/beta-hydrolase family hydrolase